MVFRMLAIRSKHFWPIFDTQKSVSKYIWLVFLSCCFHDHCFALFFTFSARFWKFFVTFTISLRQEIVFLFWRLEVDFFGQSLVHKSPCPDIFGWSLLSRAVEWKHQFCDAFLAKWEHLEFGTIYWNIGIFRVKCQETMLRNDAKMLSCLLCQWWFFKARAQLRKNIYFAMDCP